MMFWLIISCLKLVRMLHLLLKGTDDSWADSDEVTVWHDITGTTVVLRLPPPDWADTATPLITELLVLRRPSQ